MRREDAKERALLILMAGESTILEELADALQAVWAEGYGEGERDGYPNGYTDGFTDAGKAVK